MEQQILLASGNGYLSEAFDDGTLVLVEEATGVSHVLNTTGALAYRLCTQYPRPDAQVRFIEAFSFTDEETRQMAIHDFDEVVTDMLNKGILQYGSV